MQGYGNYEELTLCGVDPRALFDDIEDTARSPDFITTDTVIEECNDAVAEANQQAIESLDDINLIPIQKTRKHVRIRHSENDPSPQVLDGESIHTTHSMLSLISMPNEFEDDTRINAVTFYLSLHITNNFTIFTSLQLMWYQKNREHMEPFLAKHTSSFSKKELKVIL